MITSPADADVDPRVARSRARIRAATVDLLAGTGYDGLTMEAIADRAGVGKATVYRHWSSKAELVLDAVSCLKESTELAPSGDGFADVVAVMGHLVRLLTDGAWAGLLPTIIDAAGRDPELERLAAGFIEARRGRMRHVLARAVARGQLPADTDLDMAIDLLAGPLFYRRLVRRLPVDDATARRQAAVVWRGLGGSTPVLPDATGQP